MFLKSRRIRVVAVAAVVLVAVTLGVAGPKRVFKRALREADRSWLILTGRLVDVGGYRLRIESEGKGSPTVVLDAGLCQTMSTWESLVPEVSKFTRVIIYDRANLGRSDPGPKPRTSQQNVNELHALLVNAGITGPYVLVGHSFGGINVRLYAIEHPEEVAGMVLVEASHENQYDRFAALMPPAEREEYLQHESGNNCERVDLKASAAQVRSAGVMPALPLTVLSAGGRSESPDSPANTKLVEAQKEMQDGLAGLTPNSTHIVVEESGHFIQMDRPEVVVNAIRSVVEAVRRLAVQSRHPGLE